MGQSAVRSWGCMLSQGGLGSLMGEGLSQNLRKQRNNHAESWRKSKWGRGRCKHKCTEERVGLARPLRLEVRKQRRECQRERREGARAHIMRASWAKMRAYFIPSVMGSQWSSVWLRGQERKQYSGGYCRVQVRDIGSQERAAAEKQDRAKASPDGFNLRLPKKRGTRWPQDPWSEPLGKLRWHLSRQWRLQ